jgi:hypothetical protein
MLKQTGSLRQSGLSMPDQMAVGDRKQITGGGQ